MLPETIIKGGYAEALVAARALEKGYVPSKPMVDARYDLIIDDGNRPQRVQVKYCNCEHNNVSGSISLDLRKNSRLYSKDEIDALAIYVEPIKQICWFPISLIEHRASINIRYQPSRNNQAKNCIMASDYLW